MTKQAGHIALLGAGAIIIIVWLLRSSRSATVAESVAAAAPSLAGPENGYPNIGPANVPVSTGVAPAYIGYNSAPPPDLNAILQGIRDAAEPETTPAGPSGGCGCSQCPQQSGALVTQQKVSAPVLSNAAAGVKSFSKYMAAAAPAVSGPSSPFIYSNSGVLIGYR